MGDSIRLDLSFRNTAAVVANFRAADKRLQKEVRREVHEAGEFFRELAFFLAPVDTAWMRDHLRTVYSDDGLVFEGGFDEGDFKGRIGYNGERITYFYPIIVEFGSSTQPAQPFLRPAYLETKAQFTRNIGAAVRRSLRR